MVVRQAKTFFKSWSLRNMSLALVDTAFFEKNKYFFLTECSGFWKKWTLFLLNILDFGKMNNFWNEYIGFSFELIHVLAQFNSKMNIRRKSATASWVWGRLVQWKKFFLENFPWIFWIRFLNWILNFLAQFNEKRIFKSYRPGLTIAHLTLP